MARPVKVLSTTDDVTNDLRRERTAKGANTANSFAPDHFGDTLCRLGSHATAPFQPIRVAAAFEAITPENLQKTTAFTAKHEEVAGVRPAAVVTAKSAVIFSTRALVLRRSRLALTVST
jgi:hypothetical protein